MELFYTPYGLKAQQSANFAKDNHVIEEVINTFNELVIVGTQLYTEYAILLLITGIILILSVIGAIAITK
jgi:NADH:ubiquinone oxidoreductase subunit 6 (subunit J)